MEKIKTETIIRTLIYMGFEQVDPLLFTYTLGKLSMDGKPAEVEDGEFSSTFKFYIENNGVAYQLKQGLTLDSNVCPFDGEYWPLSRALRPDERIIQALQEKDLQEIVLKKIKAIGPDKIEDLKVLFSKKEKEIIKEMFDLTPVKKEENKKAK